MNNDTGQIGLNSRVSHICARSEGGPRWDPAMSEEENRHFSNLIPMCLEHASEIDDTEEDYPVELLREWKRVQVEEHFKMQKGWPLTDEEVQQVIEASFGPKDYGSAVAAASSLTAASRAAGRLVETARQQRQLPLKAASEWRMMRTGIQRNMFRAWDATTGELLPPVEPSRVETMPFREGLEAALQDVTKTLRPLIVTLVAELHAVRAAEPHVAPWCDWVENAAESVLTASGRWPGPPPEEDDGVLGGAVAELTAASMALSAAWHGRPAAQPPEQPPPALEPVETDALRLLREHQDLLERARPWARVDSRPYDADLYTALVEAARFAFDLPEVLMYLSLGLTATTGLAADVARNADDVTFSALVDSAVAKQPLAIAVSILRDLMLMAGESQRPKLKTETREHASRLLRAANWADQTIWDNNKFHMRQLLEWTASIRTDDEVREHIATAVTDQPELLEPVLIGISQHSERRDSDDWNRLLGIDMYIQDLPAWFPTSVVAAEIRRRYPELQEASRYGSRGDRDGTSKLAAELLYIESRLA